MSTLIPFPNRGMHRAATRVLAITVERELSMPAPWFDRPVSPESLGTMLIFRMHACGNFTAPARPRATLPADRRA